MSLNQLLLRKNLKDERSNSIVGRDVATILVQNLHSRPLQPWMLIKASLVAPMYGNEFVELINTLETDATALKHLLVDIVANKYSAH